MTTVFFVTTSILGVLVLLRIFESGREVRIANRLRSILDRAVIVMHTSINEHTKRFLHFAHSDVLMNGLHMVTYAALVCVRYIERKLVALAQMLRKFRKEREPRAPSHKLASIRHEKSKPA